MSRWSIAFLALALAAGVAQGLDAGTRMWMSVRGAAHFFSDGDQNDLERLAFTLSNPENDFPIEFYEKSWEIPFGARFGLQISPDFSIFAVYERMPYLLDAERNRALDLPPYRTDTVILRASANMFGGGLDFAVFRGTYGGTIRAGAAAGVLDVSGRDEDYLGRSNFLIDASGWFFDLYAALEYEFSRELSLYPFAQFRFARTRDYSVTHNDEDPVPDFDLDYSGLAIGIEIRIRAWPLPTGDD